MTTIFWRKKPRVIEAVEWTGEQDAINAMMRWPGGPDAILFCDDGSLEIATLEGDMRAVTGDWIIKGVKGEFYPVRFDIFAETYEPVADVATEEQGSASAPSDELVEIDAWMIKLGEDAQRAEVNSDIALAREVLASGGDKRHAKARMAKTLLFLLGKLNTVGEPRGKATSPPSPLRNEVEQLREALEAFLAAGDDHDWAYMPRNLIERARAALSTPLLSGEG